MTEDELRISLKEFVTHRFAEERRFYDRRLMEIEIAVKIALDTLNKRLETMNEFRGSIEDKASHLASKDVVEGIQRQVSELREESGVTRGKAATWSLVMSIIAIGIAALALFMRWKI